MTAFIIHQCTSEVCSLRMPIDVDTRQGKYCPRCGAPLEMVGAPYQAADCLEIDWQPRNEIFVVLDNIRSALNVGAIFRTADGVGASHLYLCGITPSPADNLKVRKTALGAEANVRWSHHLNSVQIVNRLQVKGCRVLALECDAQAVPIHTYRTESSDSRPIALVVGSERAGLDPVLLSMCDHVLALPMVGQKTSLNVAVAFGIAAYWLVFSG